MLSATVESHLTETDFMDRVLVGWSRWTRSQTINLKPTCAGDLWRITTPHELEDILTLSDDEFALVDQSVSILKGSPLYAIVQIEYCKSYGSDDRNCRRLGLTRIGYRQEKLSALWTLYTLLRPRIDSWRQRCA
jgi:hypothetical protein